MKIEVKTATLSCYNEISYSSWTAFCYLLKITEWQEWSWFSWSGGQAGEGRWLTCWADMFSWFPAVHRELCPTTCKSFLELHYVLTHQGNLGLNYETTKPETWVWIDLFNDLETYRRLIGLNVSVVLCWVETPGKSPESRHHLVKLVCWNRSCGNSEMKFSLSEIQNKTSHQVWILIRVQNISTCG